ncbi:MAG: tetratricopeptide repeat protein [Oligoflexales bacterium]|nr:tetratricopeptide repeat protein [Oligoflexales bacterium]
MITFLPGEPKMNNPWKLPITTSFFILLCGCATTSEMVKLDTGKKKAEIVSSGDMRSSQPDMKKDPSINKSVENLNESIRNNPRNVGALLNLAQLKLVQGDYNNAEKFVRQALKTDLKNQTARKILAEIYIRRGNTDMANIILNGIGGIKSRDSQIINMLAMISLKEGRNAEALARFKKALSLNAEDVAVRMNLGVLYIQFRQLNHAAIQFERVLKIMPANSDAKLHLAIIETNRKNFRDAYKIYNDILSKKRGNPLVLYNLAVLERNRENYSEAIEALNEYLKTSYANKSNGKDVYALLEDIRKRRQESGKGISDADIKNLTEKVKNSKPVQNPEQTQDEDNDRIKENAPESKKVVKAEESPDGAKPVKQKAEVPPKAQPPAKQEEPQKAPHTAIPDDDIGSLEKALQ